MVIDTVSEVVWEGGKEEVLCPILLCGLGLCNNPLQPLIQPAGERRALYEVFIIGGMVWYLLMLERSMQADRG